jgi:hypothetical protein
MTLILQLLSTAALAVGHLPCKIWIYNYNWGLYIYVTQLKRAFFSSSYKEAECNIWMIKHPKEWIP